VRLITAHGDVRHISELPAFDSLFEACLTVFQPSNFRSGFVLTED
jgi:hypothetical protein